MPNMRTKYVNAHRHKAATGAPVKSTPRQPRCSRMNGTDLVQPGTRRFRALGSRWELTPGRVRVDCVVGFMEGASSRSIALPNASGAASYVDECCGRDHRVRSGLVRT